MSKYNAEFPFPVTFPPQAMTNVLAEVISKKGLKQAHVAGQYLFVLRFTSPRLTLYQQRLKSMRTLLSSLMAVSRNNSKMKNAT